MHKSWAVHSYQNRILRLIISTIVLFLISDRAFAESAVSGTIAESFDRYNSLSAAVGDGTSVDVTTSGDLEEVEKTKEKIDIAEFNNAFLDTAIYILGGLAGMMMLLQITAFAVCKLFPSWNHLLEKLSKIGITGYEDGWLLPTIKILLLGILSYLCISGTLKHLVAHYIGRYANLINLK